MKNTEITPAGPSIRSRFWIALKNHTTDLIIGAIIALLFFVGGQIEWSNLIPVRPQTILLQEAPYHIGDTEMTDFDHSAPEANPFQASFELKRIPKEMVLTMIARDIDPNETTSAVEIWVNGNFITYLNRQFGQEVHDYQNASVPIDPRYLQKGKNFLMISVRPAVDNVDDIEFKDVKLEIR